MDIHRIQGIAFSSWLIETSEALFLVDSGFLWFEGLVLHKIRSLGRSVEDLRLAVVTHPHLDHMGAVAALRRYADFESLREYCYKVASVVGLISVEIFGYGGEEKAKHSRPRIGSRPGPQCSRRR